MQLKTGVGGLAGCESVNVLANKARWRCLDEHRSRLRRRLAAAILVVCECVAYVAVTLSDDVYFEDKSVSDCGDDDLQQGQATACQLA